MDVKEAIEKRRALRSLARVEISDETVHELAEAARLAASCFNNQPWRFVFVRKRSVLARMFEALPDGNRWATAASMIVAVMSKEDFDCRIKGRDYFLFDTGMATAHIILRATELGLVAHPIAGYSPKKVRATLGIPEDMTVIALVIFGRHAEDLSELMSEDQKKTEGERPGRLSMDKFALMDSFDG